MPCFNGEPPQICGQSFFSQGKMEMRLLCLWLSSNGVIRGRTEKKRVKRTNNKNHNTVIQFLHTVKGKLRENELTLLQKSTRTRILIQVTQGLISTQSSLPKGLSLEQGFQTILLYTKETKATSNTDSCFTVHLLHLKSNFCKLLHTRLQLFKQKDLSFSYYLIWANEGHLGLHAFVRGVTLKHFPFL